MPEAAVHEQGKSMFWKEEIGMPVDARRMFHPSSNTGLCERGLDGKFS